MALVLALGACSTGDQLESSSSSSSTAEAPASTSESESQSSESPEEKMLSSAQDFDILGFKSTEDDNPVKAKTEYDGKPYKVTGQVQDISADSDSYATLALGEVYSDNAADGFILVYLPDDELASLSIGQKVTVCGYFEYEPEPIISGLREAFIVGEG